MLLVAVIARLEASFADFDAQFAILMNMLSDSGDKASSEVLRFLKFRLDFNDYFAKQSSTAAPTATAASRPRVDAVNSALDVSRISLASGKTAASSSTRLDGPLSLSTSSVGGASLGSHISRPPHLPRTSAAAPPR